jgi:transposase
VRGPVIRLRTSGSSRLSKKLPARAWRAHLDGLPETTPVEIWFEDEARIGQKNGQVRQWARRGTRPRQPADQRYDNAYLFGAICPARGVGAALALPYADAAMMQLHLNEISRNVAVGAHAVLLLDRAGWHTTSKLDVPANITPIFLPSRAPELNPVENVWQYLRQNWLSNTVFENYDAIIDAACAAWRNLIAQPETITSIGMREWAHVGQPLWPLVYKGAALMLPALPKAKELLADKGYDAGWFRAALAKRGVAVCIPSKSNRKVAIPYDAVLYKLRHKIENMFGRLKDWRRIHTRYDRCAHTYFSAICIAAAVLLALINESWP